MTETTKEYRFKVTGTKQDHRLMKKRMKELNLELLEHLNLELYEHSFEQQRKGVLTGLGVRR